MSSVSNNSEASYYQKLFRDHANETDEQRKASSKRDDERAQRLEENYRAELRKQQADADDNVERAKEGMGRSLAYEREYNKETLRDMKDTYDRNGRTRSGESEIKTLEKRLADEHAASDVRSKVADQKLKTAEEGMHDKLAEVAQDAELSADAMRASHREETAALRQQLRDLTAVTAGLEETRSEALANDIREHENDWLLKERRMASESKREIENIRSKNKETESYMGEQNAATLREKDAYYAGVIRKQNNEVHKERTRLEGQFKTQIDDLAKQRKIENAAADLAASNQLARAHEQSTKSLDSQAREYQEILTRNNAQNKDEINQLQRALHNQKTSDDTMLISPTAEHIVRRSLIKEYEKQFDAEKTRHKASEDSMVKAHTEKLHDTLWDDRTRMTQAVRDGEAERSRDRSNMTNFVHEIEHDKATSLRFKDMENQKSSDTMNRNFGLSLERQRREYESMLDIARNDGMSKMQNLRQESDFKIRMLQREAQVRQSETVREFEKKIAETKAENDLRYEDLKSQKYTEVREAQRQGKQNLEEQQKQYEQRIAQLEAQHKERTRYLESSFQEEIDKVRRSNELLVKKRG